MSFQNRLLERQIAALALALLAVFAGGPLRHSQAAPPWGWPFKFKRVEADPNKAYKLQREHGPWLILATTFRGEGAPQQAHRLVLELRRRYNLAAYIHNRSFDDEQNIRGLGVDPWGRPKKMKPLNSKQADEIAVLVGDFPSYDDSKAQKVLEVIKQAVPESLKVDEQGRTYQSLGYLREAQRIVNKRTYNSKKGLMRHAMITRNPLLPAEYFAPRGPDALVVDMNKDVEHSLLKCRGRYTVRVATFRGNSTMKLKKIDNLKRGSTMESKLVDAAMKSHQLTLALRKLGYDAYEFHDRHESIVTVGAFQSVGQPRRDGKIEIDPAVHRIMNTFRARTQNLPGYPGAVVPHRVEGIVLDAQPMPVEVPRVSIAANYARRGILR